LKFAFFVASASIFCTKPFITDLLMILNDSLAVFAVQPGRSEVKAQSQSQSYGIRAFRADPSACSRTHSSTNAIPSNDFRLIKACQAKARSPERRSRGRGRRPHNSQYHKKGRRRFH